MRKYIAFVGATLVLAVAALSSAPVQAKTAEGASVVPHESPSIELADCFMCARDSTGACAGADECTSSRSECTKQGCKITGTRSCSSAANVKKCS